MLHMMWVVAAMLFPEPLHLTRAVEDPIRGDTTVIEEFYLGNRVISVVGDRTVIADYDRNEVMEIDRADGTYSVTPFAEIAGAEKQPTQALTSQEERWSIVKTAGRFIATPRQRSEIRRLEVSVDRSVSLSRDALDVIIGAAYPNERQEEAEVYVRAATTDTKLYALPVEESVTYDAGASEVVRRTRVTRLGKETPSTALSAVPPGARLVESRRTQTRRMLEELDRLPAARPKP
jgi:hypothetical protein